MNIKNMFKKRGNFYRKIKDNGKFGRVVVRFIPDIFEIFKLYSYLHLVKYVLLKVKLDDNQITF